jgi:hypothetical protein
MKKMAAKLPIMRGMGLFGRMKRLAGHWQILFALVLATLTALVLKGLFQSAAEA